MGSYLQSEHVSVKKYGQVDVHTHTAFCPGSTKILVFILSLVYIVIWEIKHKLQGKKKQGDTEDKSENVKNSFVKYLACSCLQIDGFEDSSGLTYIFFSFASVHRLGSTLFWLTAICRIVFVRPFVCTPVVCNEVKVHVV